MALTYSEILPKCVKLNLNSIRVNFSSISDPLSAGSVWIFYYSGKNQQHNYNTNKLLHTKVLSFPFPWAPELPSKKIYIPQDIINNT